jgi:hypothetical protein
VEDFSKLGENKRVQEWHPLPDFMGRLRGPAVSDMSPSLPRRLFGTLDHYQSESISQCLENEMLESG